MKIGATLLVYNEIDVIHQVMRHYIPVLDYFIVLNNMSTDGTREAVQSYTQCSNVTNVILLDVISKTYWQKEWVTRACKHLIQLGADWIINLDADEIYTGSIRNVIEQVDAQGFNQIYATGAFYYPTIFDDAFELNPFKRITYHDSFDIKYSNDKMIFKKDGFLSVCQGNHWAFFDGMIKPRMMRTQNILLHHYPDRSAQQFASKYRGKFSEQKLKNMGVGWQAKNRIWLEGGDEALIRYYNDNVVLKERDIVERKLIND